MSQGWIKLHRKLLDDALMSRSAYFQLWITLLLMANHKETEFIFNNRKMVLQPGQLLTGLLKLHKITKIPKSTIEKILKYLERETQIETHKTRRFTIITIKNWHKYQTEETQTGTQRGRDADTRQIPRGTYKNDKNDKNFYRKKDFDFQGVPQTQYDAFGGSQKEQSCQEMLAEMIAKGVFKDDE